MQFQQGQDATARVTFIQDKVLQLARGDEDNQRKPNGSEARRGGGNDRSLHTSESCYISRPFIKLLSRRYLQLERTFLKTDEVNLP